jgi:hypothetical protein
LEKTQNLEHRNKPKQGFVEISFQNPGLPCGPGSGINFAHVSQGLFGGGQWPRGVPGRKRVEGCFDIRPLTGHAWALKSEIIFEVTDAEEGGYSAAALGYGITTQAETVEELRSMVREAVDCYFDDPSQAPNIIRLHFVRDEVLAR